ncbi:hypothetical protein ES703_13522 [subsurface metagenome]
MRGGQSIIVLFDFTSVFWTSPPGRNPAGIFLAAAALFGCAAAAPPLAKNNNTPLLERHEQLNDNDKAGAAPVQHPLQVQSAQDTA